MKATVEPLEGNKVKLSVEVDDGEFEQALDAAFRKIAREVRIPGFRPGKAPRKLLEARLGKDTARQEALRDAVPEYYAQAVKDAELDPIAPPEIDITSEGADGAPIAFDAVVEIRPNVSIPGYAGLQVTVPSPDVTDEDVDRQIDRLRERDADLRQVERPEVREDDVVTIDVTAGETELPDTSYTVGSGSLVPGLDDQLRGAKVGDILEFEATAPGAEEPTKIRVLLKDVKEKVLPEATDEWASEASEFETLEELREDTRTRLATVKKLQASLAMRDGALKSLVQLVDEDAPQPLVDDDIRRRIRDLEHRLEHQGADIGQYLAATGTDEEQFIEQLRADATESVKADLALRALADAEELEATEEDIDTEVARLAERFGVKADRLRRDLERQEALPTVRSDIRKAKALEWLVQHVEVVDEEGRPIDRAELSPQSEESAE